MVKIVESSERHITTLRELFLKARQNTFTWADTASFNILDFDKETEGEYVLIAISDNSLVGFISVWPVDNFIHHLYVDEKYQKRGTGTALLKAALAKTKFPIRLKCIENNIKAVNFYKKNGFVEKGRGTTEEGTFILFELNDKQ
jgi:ribosomal protein S18 acetylase RimI-like enzyme